MNIDEFRLILRDLEDDEDGRPWPQTHTHDTEVSLGGVVYARKVIILDPYTVEFEDDQYAVNLVGANSNVGDKVVQNQVSVRSNNSAGLISTPLIEYGTFSGRVTVQDGSGNSGTLFPTGTDLAPVDNMDDALLIDNYRGFGKFWIKGPLTIANVDIRNKIVEGQNVVLSDIVVASSAQVLGTTFQKCQLSGTLDGSSLIDCCVIGDLGYMEGTIRDSMLLGELTLGGLADTHLVNCVDGLPGAGIPTIDVGGTGRNLGVWGWHGGLKLKNSTGADNKISVNLDTGRLVLDSTMTAGTVLVKGVGLCEDNSGPGCDVNTDGLINPGAVWDVVAAEHVDADSTGLRLMLTEKILRNRLDMDDGGTDNLVLYDDDDVTPLLKISATDKNGNPIVLPAGFPARRTRGVAP